MSNRDVAPRLRALDERVTELEPGSIEAINQHVKSLEAENAALDKRLKALGGICPHCNGRADLPPGHIERCYCLPVIRDLQERLKACESKCKELEECLSQRSNTI